MIYNVLKNTHKKEHMYIYTVRDLSTDRHGARIQINFTELARTRKRVGQSCLTLYCFNA
jgi:hypothetical protein